MRGQSTCLAAEGLHPLELTGEYAMDKADGAGTVLFDLKCARLVG